MLICIQMNTPTALFSPASIEEVSVAPDQVQTAIMAYQKDFQTGLVEAKLPDQSWLDLLFVRGQIVNIYKRAEKTERIQVSDLLDYFHLSEEKITIRAISLSPQAIRLAKILLEQLGTGDPLDALTNEIETQVDKWRALPYPGLVHIRWPGAEALALLPGHGRPSRHTLLIAADQILHSPGGMQTFYNWREPGCIIRYYSSESQTQAWQEYLLHYSFVWMSGHLLTRFEELTGRLLLSSVLRETNFSAVAHGLNISFAPGNVTDQAIFASPEESTQAYRRLLGQIFTHVETAIGADLLKALIQESTMRMQPSYRRVFQENFNFARLRPPDLSERAQLVGGRAA
jgi:hypothetical protein